MNLNWNFFKLIASNSLLCDKYEIVIEAKPIGKKLINAIIEDAILKFEKSIILTYFEKSDIVNNPVIEPKSVEPK